MPAVRGRAGDTEGGDGEWDGDDTDLRRFLEDFFGILCICQDVLDE